MRRLSDALISSVLSLGRRVQQAVDELQRLFLAADRAVELRVVEFFEELAEEGAGLEVEVADEVVAGEQRGGGEVFLGPLGQQPAAVVDVVGSAGGGPRAGLGGGKELVATFVGQRALGCLRKAFGLAGA